MIEQQGLRTPTEPRFGNSYIHGIRGLAFASAFTGRSRAAPFALAPIHAQDHIVR
jgi:hypothetical protein